MFALFADRCAVVLLYLSMVGAGFAAHLPPAELAPFFAPPQQYRSDFGQFRSPLLFTKGTPVRTPADGNAAVRKSFPHGRRLWGHGRR